jgi:hypothetical protein
MRPLGRMRDARGGWSSSKRSSTSSTSVASKTMLASSI